MISHNLNSLVVRLRTLSAPDDLFGLAISCDAIASDESNPSAAVIGGKLLALGHLLDGHALTETEWDAIKRLADQFADILVQELPADEAIRAWDAFRCATPLR